MPASPITNTSLPRPSWWVYSFYLMESLVVSIFVSSAVIFEAIRGAGALPALGWILLLLGPLLSGAAIVHASFAYWRGNSHGILLRPLAPPAFTVAFIGVMCSAATVAIVLIPSVQTAGWVAGIVLQLAGAASLIAACVLAVTRPNPSGPIRSSSEGQRPTGDVGQLFGLDNEIMEDARRHRESAQRWAWLNYGLGFLTATLSGAAGIAGLTDAPPALKSIFAVLAVVGAGLAALSTSLRASENQQRKQDIASELEGLSRTIRWREVPVPNHSVIRGYVQRYNAILDQTPQYSVAPDSPSQP
jgi:hypothetical protein